MRAAIAFKLNRLCFRFLSCRLCSLAVALHAHSHSLVEVHIGVDIVNYLKFLRLSGQSYDTLGVHWWQDSGKGRHPNLSD